MKDNGDSETATLGFMGRWHLNRLKDMGERILGRKKHDIRRELWHMEWEDLFPNHGLLFVPRKVIVSLRLSILIWGIIVPLHCCDYFVWTHTHTHVRTYICAYVSQEISETEKQMGLRNTSWGSGELTSKLILTTIRPPQWKSRFPRPGGHVVNGGDWWQWWS